VTRSAAGQPEAPDVELGLLAQTCDALFRDHAGDHPGERDGWWDERLWAALEQAGIPLISVPEAAGGSGGTLEQAAVALISAGEHAARVPAAETALLGGWLLAKAGLPVPAGPLVAVRACAEQRAGGADTLSITRVTDGWLVQGRLPRVGWGRVAQRVVVVSDAGVTGAAQNSPSRCGQAMSPSPRAATWPASRVTTSPWTPWRMKPRWPRSRTGRLRRCACGPRSRVSC